MMKSMRNQKGLTLIELLGALTITMIILGVATMLLSSVLGMFNSSTQTYEDKSKMKLTMNTLTAQLSDSTQAVYYPSSQELRYKNGNTYKAAIFNSVNNELSIYDFSNDGDLTNDDAQYKNSTISLTSDIGLYTKRMILSDDVDSVVYKQSGGTAVPSVPLTNGEIIQIDITFNFYNTKASGSSNVVKKISNTSVKLLVDSTSK